MIEIKVAAFVADDGETFTDKKSCLEHEFKNHNENLISQFEVYDVGLKKLDQPNHMWSNDRGVFDIQLNKFDYKKFIINAAYIFFKENANYKTLRKCFKILGENTSTNLSLPEFLGNSHIVYYDNFERKWFSADIILKRAKSISKILEGRQ